MSWPKKKIVCVEWEDAASHSGYYNKDKRGEISTVNCRTVGYLLEKTKRQVRVSAEEFEDGEFRYVHTIPRKIVKKITVLAGGDKCR